MWGFVPEKVNLAAQDLDGLRTNVTNTCSIWAPTHEDD